MQIYDVFLAFDGRLCYSKDNAKGRLFCVKQRGGNMMKRLIACMLTLVLLMLPVTSMPASALNGNPCEKEDPIPINWDWEDHAIYSADRQYQYMKNNDGTITFLNYCNDNVEELVIPAEIDGMKVTCVNGFDRTSVFESGNIKRLVLSEGIESIAGWGLVSDVLESVVLPDSVTSIGERAFYMDEKLRSVTLGNGLTTINTTMFERCESLEELTLPKSVSRVSREPKQDYINETSYLKNLYVDPANPYFTSVDGVLYSKDKKEIVYYPAQHGSSYTILPGTEKIGANTFRYTTIEQVVLPNSLKSIGENAFAVCSISSLNLPASVSSFSADFFARCYYLASFTVAANSPYFSAVNGVLFNKSKTELVAYPRAKETASYQIPAGVKTIKAHAFDDSFYLTGVSFADSVEVVEAYAFANCRELAQVQLNNGLKEIGSFGFTWSRALKQLALPATLETIGYAAFYWSGIREIVIPASLKTLGASAFEWSSLEKIEIKAPLTAIGTETFSTCNYLKEIALPDTLTYIGPYAFCGLKNSIVIPESVQEIDPCAFYYSTCTLKGSRDSYAKRYAQDYDLPFEEIEIQVVPQLQSILEGAVELAGNDYTYDGSAKQPAVTLKFGAKMLKEGTDYSVRYEDNTNAGTARAIVTGIGDYTDSLTLSFNIRPQDVSALTCTVGSYDAVYNGGAKCPVITVKDGARTLTQGKDYAVTYADNIAAGTAGAKVICMGNYAGSTTVPYVIEEKSVRDLSLTVQGSYTYDGTEKYPTVTLKDGDKTLNVGTHYTVTYADNVNAGTAKVTVTGTGNYCDSVTRNFTIAKRPIGSGKLSLSENCYGYDGTAKRPDVTVELGGITLSASDDYTVSYSNNTNIGTARATATGKGNYTGTLYQDFTIEKRSKSIAQMDIRLNGSSDYTTDYTGKAITPYVEVWDGNVQLDDSRDFEVGFFNNVNAGTAGTVITGLGNYEGEVTKTFWIKPISCSKVNVSIEKVTYDNPDKRPGVTATYDGKTLVEGTDYDIARFSSDIETGYSDITIRFKGNYTGSIIRSSTIERSSFDKAEIKLQGGSLIYDGEEKKPAVTVKYGDKTLKEGTDYTLRYSNNINAGKAYVNVTPKGNYSGTSKSIDFTIIQRNICYASWDYSPKSFSYDGTAKKPTLTPLTYNGMTLKSGTDYTVAYEDNVSAGEAIIRITGKGNYFGGAVENFYITGVAIPTSGVSLTKYTYDYTGSEIRPTVTVKVSGKTLTLNKDYTVSYSNNISAGTGKAIVTGKGSYTGTVKTDFTIKAKKYSFTWGKNNWAFTNSGPSFYTNYKKNPGANEQRHIDLMNSTYISALKRNLTTKQAGLFHYDKTEYERIFGEDGWIYNNWGGSCYGMSALVMLDCAGLVPNSSYTSGAKNLHDNTVAKNNSKVANLITYYYLLQGKEAICDHKEITSRRSHSDNIKKIVSNVTNFGVSQVDYRWYDSKWKGHAVIAYGHTSGSWSYGGVTYNRCIKIADPNTSTENANYHVYYRTSDYSWTIPGRNRCSSANNAYFNVCNSDVGLTNYGGYLGGTSYSPSNSAMESTATARLDAMESASDATLTKAYENNDEYYASATGEDMVKESYTPLSDEEAETIDGYTLHDVDSSYILNQSVDAADLKLDCLNYIYKVRGSAVKTAVFDKDHKVRIDGDDTDYFLSMTVNDEQPTDWFTLSVEGGGADSVTLEMADQGYVLSSDNLSDVTVKAYNAENNAELTFSTDYQKVLLYEINETTIGLRADLDGNGSFDRDLEHYDLTPIDTFNVNVSDSVVYTGEQMTPDVTVNNGDETLVEGRDYTVYYDNNVEIGNAVVTVKGIGSYVGSLTADFLITEDPGKLLGDTDNDTDVSVSDVTLIQRYVGTLPVPDENRVKEYGDIDDNHEVEIIDATYLQYWIADMGSPYPIGHAK